MNRHTDTVEVIVQDQRRRCWSLAEKSTLVRRTYEPSMSVSLVARQEGVSASLLFQWHKLERQGALTAVSAGESVVPASELAAARAEIAKLQRILGKKTLENEILKEAVEYAAGKKVDCALAIAVGRWPVMAVCRALGVARSNVHLRQAHAPARRDGRRGRAQAADAELLAELRKHVLELPSYGYRRACALLNRQRAASGLASSEPQTRLSPDGAQWLAAAKGARRRQSSRLHTGKVEVAKSDQRWCSDGFEIHCDSGQTVTATFAKDCCDREIMAGVPGRARVCRVSQCARCLLRRSKNVSGPLSQCQVATPWSS